MKIEFYQQFFEKYSNIIFQEIRSVRAGFCHTGRTEGWTDLTKLIVPIDSFANALINRHKPESVKRGWYTLLYCTLFDVTLSLVSRPEFQA
jgi:hypothetical protein